MLLNAKWFAKMERVVASVHLCPSYPVQYAVSAAKKRYGAQYEAKTENAPDVIRVSHAHANPHIAFVHETGHRVERRGLVAPGANFYATWADPALTEWREAVVASVAIRRDMKYCLRTGSEKEIKLIQYLVQPHELWARSYAQYIVLKSQNVELLQELRGLQNDIQNADILPSQWQDTDFIAISDTINRLFVAKGWIP